MVNICWPHISSLEQARRLQEARSNLELVCLLYRLQRRRGRHYIRGRPQAASSWSETRVLDVGVIAGGTKLAIDQCRRGLVSAHEANEALPARKAIAFLPHAVG